MAKKYKAGNIYSSLHKQGIHPFKQVEEKENAKLPGVPPVEKPITINDVKTPEINQVPIPKVQENTEAFLVQGQTEAMSETLGSSPVEQAKLDVEVRLQGDTDEDKERTVIETNLSAKQQKVANRLARLTNLSAKQQKAGNRLARVTKRPLTDRRANKIAKLQDKRSGNFTGKEIRQRNKQRKRL